MNNPRIDTRMLLIIGLVVIVGALFIIPRLNQGEAGVEDAPGFQDDPNFAPVDRGNPGAVDSSVNLGNVVASTNVDRDGCPVNATNVFEPIERVYIVAQNSDVQAGATVFVRLYQDGQPVEDAPEITADQDYTNSCINFVFEPETGARFDPGRYEAEFVVNGNPADSVQFEIR